MTITLRELSQIRYLKKEIVMYEQQLRDLEHKAMPGAQAMSGMPHGGQVADKVGQYGAMAADTNEEIKAKKLELEELVSRLEQYIASISDSLTRQVFTYRFVGDMNWEKVALKVGGNNTEDSVKKRCYRYLKNAPGNKTCPECPE